jgi:tRNA(Ile2)-agmatinylcytidine synthase
MVKKAFGFVKPLEPLERWVIFRTNEGTDMHLRRAVALNQIKPYNSVIARGIVSRNPRIIPLRHVIFSIKDESGEVDCAAYEPTGDLRKVARELIIGDNVEVYGAVRKPSAARPLTINLEKINILELAPKTVWQNPACPKCGRRLESMGKGKGFRCRKCGARFDDVEKRHFTAVRELKAGLYVTSTRSQRHLTKPLRRYGLEKRHSEAKSMIKEWHFP